MGVAIGAKALACYEYEKLSSEPLAGESKIHKPALNGVGFFVRGCLAVCGWFARCFVDVGVGIWLVVFSSTLC